MADRRRAKDAERRKHRILVYLDHEEHERIERTSKMVRLPKSVFLRRVALGSPPKAVLDPERLRELLSVRAELARLGGVLTRLIEERPGAAVPTTEVRRLLQTVEGLAEEVRTKVREL